MIASLLERITVDPQVCRGAPTVRGLRYPVEMIVGLLAAGMTTDEVLADYPDLVAEDVLASLECAALVTNGNIRNDDLITLFEAVESLLVEALEHSVLVEVSRDAVIGH